MKCFEVIELKVKSEGRFITIMSFMRFAVYYAKVSVEAKQFECANIIKSVLLIFDRIKNPFTLYYSIQGNIGHHFFSLLLPSLAAGRILIYLSFSLLTQMCLREYKDEAKLFASVKRWKLHVVKITLYTVIDRQHCCVSFSVSYHHW